MLTRSNPFHIDTLEYKSYDKIISLRLGTFIEDDELRSIVEAVSEVHSRDTRNWARDRIAELESVLRMERESELENLKEIVKKMKDSPNKKNLALLRQEIETRIKDLS